ncbi:MAG: hypothetical protein U5N55_12635, partial [Cypionkella sp.]|nr:hypothetical protein [Cypionkella sp.]
MEDGTGDRAQGAPNLVDAIWLYGGARETINYTVTNARFGVMPPWAWQIVRGRNPRRGHLCPQPWRRRTPAQQRPEPQQGKPAAVFP